MSKYTERIKAREMRKKGLSIVVIAKKLGVTKGSVSLWCRDIVLTPEQSLKLVKNRGISFSTGQRMATQANRDKKIRSINEAEGWAKHNMGRISERELMLVATALYWAEGSKSDSTSRFMFVNSDPEMILIIKKFLIDVLEVLPEDIGCAIQINQVHKQRIKKVLIFWKKLLQLNNSQMRKPYFVNTNSHKVYENYDTYFGVCRLFVSKSKRLKYKMLALIKAFKLEILSA